MKRHAVVAPIKSKHSDLDIGRFLKVPTSFFGKVRKELLNENTGDELASTSKRKHLFNALTHSPAHSLGTPEFVRKVHDMA
ncbi:unnamed protein product [Hymenolepis diminuta]|uniref:Transcriptional regulator n=1 Tax=Hymenolepis diminuta TaxID=6216 RepID=A0A0R3S8K9_HYMDI|nr:unnamed protein product [Hymenolepis diminuta]VUZ48757.1 unnamed protein product [Hymenolepis diminuta]